MGRIAKRVTWLFVLAPLLLAAPASAQSAKPPVFYDGLIAYNFSEYRKAAAIWRRLAEAGDGKAQSGLGLLYYSGFGVMMDYDEARKWFLKSAAQGIVQAQMFMSVIYMNGDGVPQDYQRAYMWSDVAVAGGADRAITIRDVISVHLTDAEVREAERLSVEWRAFHNYH